LVGKRVGGDVRVKGYVIVSEEGAYRIFKIDGNKIRTAIVSKEYCCFNDNIKEILQYAKENNCWDNTKKIHVKKNNGKVIYIRIWR